MKFYKVTTDKLKELKTWAQIKSPRPLRPALSYALDWLAPELLGTGFRMVEISDYSVKGLVPARSTNFDFQKEIHQGLVINAGIELARSFLQQQMPESLFQVISSKVVLSKKQKWNGDLSVHLHTDAAAMDDFFIAFQKRKHADVHFDMQIKIDGVKKHDTLQLTLALEKTSLIS